MHNDVARGTPPTAETEPWYLPTGDEVALFEAAYAARLPVLLKGPTGCGKTRFIEFMASRLQRSAGVGRSSANPGDQAQLEPRRELPLVTVVCNEDLTASDLVGRFLLIGDETVWTDGPLTRAVRHGSICYLDEIVEARKDTSVIIHSVTDHRRVLPIDKTGELVDAHPDFLLVISYNPGYQSITKDLKPSTRQRFVSIEFNYPSVEIEAEIIGHESGVAPEVSVQLARVGEHVRRLKEHGFEDGVSTRLLIYAGQLIVQGIDPRRACDVAIARAVSDDPDVHQAIADIIDVLLP
jgi:nitric oxide reductase NorQ protein